MWLAVALGGAVGALARYATMTYLFPVSEHRLPLGTLCVNILGSACIGFLYIVIVERSLLSAEWKALLMTGFLGAFTTFSTFALDAVILWQNGHSELALFYVLCSVIGCILAAWLTIQLTLRFF